MLTHLLTLLGLVLLCAGWMLFQLWLGRQNPEKKNVFRLGCGACSNKGCSQHTGNGAEQAAEEKPRTRKGTRRCLFLFNSLGCLLSFYGCSAYGTYPHGQQYP